jgi:hypothetical protein
MDIVTDSSEPLGLDLANRLLQRWVDHLLALREDGVTPEAERFAYAALADFIVGAGT